MNSLGEKLAGVSNENINDALNALQRGDVNIAKNAISKQVYKVVREWLDESHGYMETAGVNIGDLGVGKDYFPRVWDTSYISGHQADFLAMLDKYVRNGKFTGDPKAVLRRLVASEGNEFRIETGRPGMQFAKERVLSFISPEDSAQFVRKNMPEILNSYITQATRRAEWSRRFGDDNSKLAKLLAGARDDGATSEEIKYAEKYIKSVNGTLGDNIDPGLRKAFGNMLVYQNIRLLPLAIFSSMPDAMGIVVRGGTVSEGFKTFKRGISEMRYNFRKEGPERDYAYRFAELMGTIDNASLTHTLGAMYSQGMVGDTGRKFNDTFFKYNLMEQYNMTMRVAATQAAKAFIERHADGTASKHSVRWMEELGFKPGEVSRGKFTEADGLTPDQALQMRAAINKWVDGAILRPNAAHKPAWMSDPHWALVSHLKQFVYSFHETIIKRTLHEMEHGNYTPAMALMSYIPIMLAADAAKGLLQTGFQGQPSYKDDWDLMDYLGNSTQRSGIFGVSQFGIDAIRAVHRGESLSALQLGPTVEQLGDAVQTVGGHEQFGTFIMHAAPANSLYSGLMKGASKADTPYAD
jgi:hypothetical protein